MAIISWEVEVTSILYSGLYGVFAKGSVISVFIMLSSSKISLWLRSICFKA